jgi:SAM-dependent MidA family methyltransferase
MLIPLELAPLTAEERAHEVRVIERIGAAIAAAGGWLPFADYMELALYAPGLGYYAAGAHKLGAGGDFTTAPELSPVFARCLANQCTEVLAALGGGEILEIGAGTGALAHGLLAELARTGTLPARYRILELSGELRERQQRTLSVLPPAIAARVSWEDRVPAAPLEGLVLANEVLDALPVDRFRLGARGVEALGVAVEDGRFAWHARAAEGRLLDALAEIEATIGEALPAGYVSELSLRLSPWLAAVTAPLERGIALFMDYGMARTEYYAPGRDGGTLGCFHRQRRHDDPFVNVGLQDITAAVDFTRVAEAGLAAGFTVAGYTSQAHFLLANGFEQQLAAVRAAAGPGDEPLLARAAARLVLPGDMGERFKCIALARGYPSPLRGFALRDDAARL